jgi:hypothetical protein
MEKAGILGFITFLIAFFGTALMIGSDWSEMFVAPLIFEQAPEIMENTPTRLLVGFIINYVLETLGWLLFGIAVFRANVYPRAVAIMLVVGALLQFFAGIPWIIVVMNGAITWMGWIVWRGTATERTSVTTEVNLPA